MGFMDKLTEKANRLNYGKKAMEYYVKDFGDFKAKIYSPNLVKEENWRLVSDEFSSINHGRIKTYENVTNMGNYNMLISRTPIRTEFHAGSTRTVFQEKSETITMYHHLKVTYVPFTKEELFKKKRNDVMNMFRGRRFTSYKVKHLTLGNAYIVIERYNEGYSQYRRNDVHFDNIAEAPFPSLIE